MRAVPAKSFDLTPKFDPIPIQIGQKKNYSFDFHIKQDKLFAYNNSAELVLGNSIGGIKSKFATLADSYKLNGNQDTGSVILRYDNYNPGYGEMKNVSAAIRLIHQINTHTSFEAQYSKILTFSSNYGKLGLLPNSSEQSAYIGFRHEF